VNGIGITALGFEARFVIMVMTRIRHTPYPFLFLALNR
jgi:hypothetical protein